MASSSPVHITSLPQPSASTDTSRTGLVSSVGSARSYGTVRDSPSHSFLSSGLAKNCLFHTVEEGDTLQGLALKYNVTVHQIQRLNNLWNTESLHIRPTIKIPVAYSNNSSRSQSPSPTMSQRTETNPRLSVEQTNSESPVSNCNGTSLGKDEVVKSKTTVAKTRYETHRSDGGVKSIADILNCADEQLKLSREFAEKLAQRSAERALPEGAYNRSADMKDQKRPVFRASPSPFDSQSMESSTRSQTRRKKVEQSSERESASREELVDQIFEL